MRAESTADSGDARERTRRHATLPRDPPHPGVRGPHNLGDRTKSAGGHGHSMSSVPCGKAFAYKIVVLFVRNILFRWFNLM